jgi:hypothetical protein
VSLAAERVLDGVDHFPECGRMCRVFQGFEQRVAFTAGEIELACRGLGDVNG